MLINYLVKRQRQIAVFFFSCFYAQLVCAAKATKLYSDRAIRYSYTTVIPGVNSDYKALKGSWNSFTASPGTHNNIRVENAGKQILKPATVKAVRLGGPSQPEMQAFQSVNANNMVDLFTGDFSYNVPLMDVGGYPINLSYRSGITMDQEASWVGLGWNINPGNISRNVRGLPDDFNGTEKVTKTYSVMNNWTAGITAGANPEIFGKDISKLIKLGVSVGAFYNRYQGIGFELGVSATVNAGKFVTGTKTTIDEKTKVEKIDTTSTTRFNPSLSLTINSQQGLGLEPRFDYRYGKEDAKLHGASSISANYNSRQGLKDLQLSFSEQKLGNNDLKNLNYDKVGSVATISFAKSTYTPTITVPFTSYNVSLTVKAGGELFGFHPLGSLTGYYSNQFVHANDKVKTHSAYGYLYYQNANNDADGLLDFNREKDIPYRKQTPHAAIPIYTYDTYSITGEGTGGLVRPYRGDVGYIRDHGVKSKNGGLSAGFDIGGGNAWHQGVDVQLNYAKSETNGWGWNQGNAMSQYTTFQKNNNTYEAVYFRNPSEQTTNSQEFYDNIGGDDVVRVNLSKSFGNMENVALNSFDRFSLQKRLGTIAINNTIVKTKRDKRSQVISYLTASEATIAGLDKTITSYPVNVFPKGKCNVNTETINRVDNTLRLGNHLSEIDVLNADGRRYVYGVPAYTIKQKEVTFAVDRGRADMNAGLVGYSEGADNSINNTNGKDRFFSSEETPGYAHTFLLSAILSPDYVDVTGDGISEDDLGDAVKFNYSRMNWSNSTVFKWRAPYQRDSATYNEGLKTDWYDDKGNYVYGEKEIWYLNSIESKTMLATFTLEDRVDNNGVNDENGGRNSVLTQKRIKEINLYTKADFVKNGNNARPIKTVHFEYDYSLCRNTPSSVINPGTTLDSGKLTLKKVWFSYNGNNRGQKNPYTFKYHSNNPDFTNKSYDRWGNYKTAEQNPGSITNADYPYAVQDKTTADNNAAAWTLNEVKLPSGAKINVEYESDDYAYIQNRRAGNMFKVVGMGSSSNFSAAQQSLYDANPVNLVDYRYIFIRVSDVVSSKDEIYKKYLRGISNNKLYFRMSVRMPKDGNGSGYENVPFYAEYEDYGLVNSNVIWIQLKEFGKNQSFPAVAAIQMMRLDLPSKAYPGSDVRREPGPIAAIKASLSLGREFINTIVGFNKIKRLEGAARSFDSTRSFIRLNNPGYKKMGGGLRVKKVVISDNWFSMTGQKESYYGQEYDYTTVKDIDGVKTKISSGVASYEPNVGNEENPFREPIEFQENVTMAPADYFYSEYPYCETYFPSPNVGYSKVTVSSINKRNLKSFNGWEETEFYTTYDFPTKTDYTAFDGDSRKTGKFTIPVGKLLSLKRTTLSQGFKIDLNDMNGKLKSQKSYAANDSLRPFAYTINYYKTEQNNSEGIKLSNTVPVALGPDGKINPTGLVGKDVELMMDSREQKATSKSLRYSGNGDVFVIGIFPVTVPSYIPGFNIGEDRFRSLVTLKVVQRYGILDSVVRYEKGSLVSTKNVLWDGETGDVLLTRTQNEFNDPVYNFSYPAHWKYSGMEPAYKNIGAVYSGLTVEAGRVVNMNIDTALESGDEVMVLSSSTVDPDGCKPLYQSPSSSSVLWVVDTSKTSGGATRQLFFIDRNGDPYNAKNVSIKIIRSGKRNMASASIGSVISLREPLDKSNAALWQLKLDSTIGVISTGANEFKDLWRVSERLTSKTICRTVATSFQKTMYPTGKFLTRARKIGGTLWTAYPVIVSTQFCATMTHAGWNISTSCADSANNHSKLLLTRGILVFDSLATIPSGAVVTGATLALQNIPPRGIWPNECPVWRDVTVSQSLATSPNFGDNTSYLKRITQSWTSSTALTDQIQSNPTDNFDTKSTTQNQVTLAASTTACQNETVTCTNLVQDMVSNPSQNFGFLLRLSVEDGAPSKNTLYIKHKSFYAGVTPPFSYPGQFSCPVTDPKTGQAIYNDPELTVNYTYPVTVCIDTCVSIFSSKVNPYVQGVIGNWRMVKGYTFYDSRKETDPTVATNIRRDGEFKKFIPYWGLNATKLISSSDTKWVWNSEMKMFNKKGFEIENKDALGRYNSGLYGYNNTMPVAVAQNAKYREIAYEGFEDYDFKTDSCFNGCVVARQYDFSFYSSKITQSEQHTGRSSIKLTPGDSVIIVSAITSSTAIEDSAKIISKVNTNAGCIQLDSFKLDSRTILPVFSPYQSKDMLLSAWVKESKDCKCNGYVNNQIVITYLQGTLVLSTTTLQASGNIIEGWQRYEAVTSIPGNATSIKLAFKNTSSGSGSTNAFFDDLRILPFNGNMKSFVYNPVNMRLMAELDENNYASYYEYDDEGTLVRVKKETQKGVKTIQETRSSLIKQ